MKGAAVSKITMMVTLMAIMLMMMKTGNAITCGQVDSALMPCVPYLTSGGNPASSCCAGVSRLKSMVSTTEDRRAACSCAKEAANRYHNLKEDAATSLPSKCGVQISVPISRTVDCSTIS